MKKTSWDTRVLHIKLPSDIMELLEKDAASKYCNVTVLLTGILYIRYSKAGLLPLRWDNEKD